MHRDIEFPSKRSESEETAAPSVTFSNGRIGSSELPVLKEGTLASKHVAFFIHGTPGEAEDWRLVWDALEELQFECFRISLDRPGFGERSDWLDAEDWDEQIDCFEETLLEEMKGERSLLVVGHSYGAALAMGLAQRLDAAHRVSGLVLVSGVLSPLERQCRWYHRLLLLPVLSSFFPKSYVQSAKEMSAVGRHLEALDKTWGRCRFPVSLIHGDEDRGVPLGNSEYAAERLVNCDPHLIRVRGGEHALTRTHAALVAKEIVATFSRVPTKEEVSDER